MENEQSRALGAHRVRQEGELVAIVLHGPLSLSEAQTFHGLVAEVLKQHGHAYVLADCQAGGALTAETRRWIAEWNRHHRVDGVALYGANLFVRTMISLVLNAISLLGSRAVPARFAKDEGEARAWLASLRTG